MEKFLEMRRITENYKDKTLLHLNRWVEKRRIRKEDKPLVSIIIATYNRSRILVERTIPLLINQTYSNIEVIIIGDNCIDDTPEYIKKIKDSRVYFKNLKRRGKYPKDPYKRWFVQGAKPRNEGQRIAKGKWLAFISDDDMPYPNYIETLVGEVEGTSYEFISASYEAIKDGRKIVVDPGINNYGSELVCGGMQTWLMRNYLKCFKWNIRSWKKKHDKPIDYDLQERLYRSGVRMKNINKIVCFVPEVEGTNTSGQAAALISE